MKTFFLATVLVLALCLIENSHGFTWIVHDGENENVEQTLNWLVDCVRTKSLTECDRLKRTRAHQHSRQQHLKQQHTGHSSNGKQIHLINFESDQVGSLDEKTIKVYRLVKESVHIIHDNNQNNNNIDLYDDAAADDEQQQQAPSKSLLDKLKKI